MATSVIQTISLIRYISVSLVAQVDWIIKVVQ